MGPYKGTRLTKRPTMSLSRDELSTIIIFGQVNKDWVREVHRFTSQRKKKSCYVVFRNRNNKKLFSLEDLKMELEDPAFLDHMEFKTAFCHDIVSNKVGANTIARKAAKAWMTGPVVIDEEKVAAAKEKAAAEKAAKVATKAAEKAKFEKLAKEAADAKAAAAKLAEKAAEALAIKEAEDYAAKLAEAEIKAAAEAEAKKEAAAAELAQEAAEALAKQLVEEAELKTAAEVKEEAAVATAEEVVAEVVEDVIVEVAAPEELSPVKITSSAKTEEIEAALV